MRSPRLPQPSPEALAASERLAAAVRAQIEDEGGWMPFDRYMEAVLYTPGLGYYAAGARKFGDARSGGDFVTAPEIGPLFAQALAAQVTQVFESSAPRIVEFGAGSGVLARDLLDALDALGVPVERYAIVEVSPDLRERQARLLAGRPVEWLDVPPKDFEGLIVANEVLDVMPVKLFVKRDGAAFQRGVAVREGRFAFEDRPADARLADAVAAIERETGELPDGYASEIGFVAHAWMRTIARRLVRGVLLAIDYGFPRREYYHPQRLMGTIMCHYRHHAHADPFWLPGLNDVTAHVDFTSIADAAHEAGLDVLGYTSQAHFLLNCGVLDRLRDGHTHVRASEAHRLLSEAEMGELFKVLAVGRGIDAPLLGFARGDRVHTL
ncbi:MAG: class I SAM-dependent methyltransferase [Burkholderiaceae bacterium]